MRDERQVERPALLALHHDDARAHEQIVVHLRVHRDLVVPAHGERLDVERHVRPVGREEQPQPAVARLEAIIDVLHRAAHERARDIATGPLGHVAVLIRGLSKFVGANRAVLDRHESSKEGSAAARGSKIPRLSDSRRRATAIESPPTTMAPTRWCGVTAQSVPLLSFGEVWIAIEATPRTRATRTARTAFGCRRLMTEPRCALLIFRATPCKPVPART